jgi:glutamine amidotransferase
MKSNEQLKIAIVDYGMGNVLSVRNALSALRCPATVSRYPSELMEADGLILPGVGAFGLAMENLRSLALVGLLNEYVIDNRKPILGICLGMQLFGDRSSELGNHEGLGWIPGAVSLLAPNIPSLSVPHVGWNETNPRDGSPLFRGITAEAHFYFDHSFHFQCDERFVMARADYGGNIVAAVGRENILGVQFHPEKSQNSGLRLMRNFLNFVSGWRESNGC